MYVPRAHRWRCPVRSHLRRPLQAEVVALSWAGAGGAGSEMRPPVLSCCATDGRVVVYSVRGAGALPPRTVLTLPRRQAEDLSVLSHGSVPVQPAALQCGWNPDGSLWLAVTCPDHALFLWMALPLPLPPTLPQPTALPVALLPPVVQAPPAPARPASGGGMPLPRIVCIAAEDAPDSVAAGASAGTSGEAGDPEPSPPPRPAARPLPPAAAVAATAVAPASRPSPPTALGASSESFDDEEGPTPLPRRAPVPTAAKPQLPMRAQSAVSGSLRSDSRSHSVAGARL